MYVSEQEVRALLTYEALIPAIRQALIDYSAGLVIQPPRTIMRAGNATDHRNGWFATMPVIYGDVMAVKNVTFYPGNSELGLPTHMAVIELLRRSTGEPLAVMDGRLITEMRTAAVSAVALSSLRPQNARTLGILGSGVQARSHLEAFRHVAAFSDVRIWSRTQSNAERLASETSARATSIEEAAAADVVLTVTSSTVPLLKGKWLAPHALVIAVGAAGASVRELDDELVRSSYVVAECKAAAERESGDIILSGAKVDAEIGAIAAAGKLAAPTQSRILFKSVGMAIEDLTAARIVCANKH